MCRHYSGDTTHGTAALESLGLEECTPRSVSASCKGVTIYRGGSEPITRDIQLGNLRDTYYEDAYGSLEPPQQVDASKVVQLDSKRPAEETTTPRKRPN